MNIGMIVVPEQFKHIVLRHNMLTFPVTCSTVKADCWSVKMAGVEWNGCCYVNNKRGSKLNCDSVTHHGYF
jgi:hypothetical protein